MKMVDTFLKQKLMERIPQQAPFRFIDDISFISEDFIRGEYTYREDEYFYKGHFPKHPITPGVILIETMAQIGLLALGIYLLKEDKKLEKVFLTSSNIDFKSFVLPGEKVVVEAKKKYFRLNKLKCEVSMHHETKGVICSGTISGMFLENS